ncbi:pyridoxamine 5'-phosphate oxidase family protein [Sphingomonas sp. BIUV-7]|uniref:Pyridoxamine 5'-phosphate oxidase family protein n=1 Tax=Sphingomonas natans TaxID=3063330 RepID=A0ABT8YDE4_9SPHN|nr:pyridoxamine 5'-phosphate oxidase family protein [Sphingomonas sp. BIUV-7]MDO6416350.1 pyridoxamine 5'-phosphate oxidase family protein [Sphingomonas sp. BIUV-7]
MADDAQIEARFWTELKASPFVMLGLDGARDGYTQPMTAQIDGDDSGPLYFFTTKDNGLVAELGTSDRAIATFTGKGHDLFASIHGSLSIDSDPATIDRLWNSHVEAWYEGGKSDPKLALLRLDTESAKIWLGGSSIGAALTRLFGKDPKASYKDNVAEVAL